MKRSIATFDDFLQDLQFQVAGAQKGAQEMYEKKVRRYFDLTSEGQLKAVNWKVDLGSESNNQKANVELPLLSLFPVIRQAITQVALEFDADIRQSPGFSKGRGPLQIVIKKRSLWKKTDGHKIKIVLLGDQPGRVQVYIDGELFKTLDGAKITPQTMDGQ